MQKLNIIKFKNPPLTYSGLPHAHTMICNDWGQKVKDKNTLIEQNKLSNTMGVDYIQPPRTDDVHLARVLEARRNKLNYTTLNKDYKPNKNARVRSVVYPTNSNVKLSTFLVNKLDNSPV